MGKIKDKYKEENFTKTIKSCSSIVECLGKLNLINGGANRVTINKYINKYNLDISHFVKFDRSKDELFVVRPLSEVLIENSTYNRTALKKRLYKEGLKNRECELCGQGEEWKGKKMSLILDHINGIGDDNRLENLRMVCPNCNATLPTHCGRNKRKRNLRKIENGISINDKVDFRSVKTKEKIERDLKRRKVKNRPSIDIITKEVKENGYSATGRKYGVSDNAIRKWLK